MEAVDVVVAESLKYPGDDRPVFIGQAPSRYGDPTKPLTGRPGRRLAGMASMTPMEFYLSAVRANLLSYYHGGDGRGDVFPMSMAMASALRLAVQLNGRVVVFLGKKVAKAFGRSGRWFHWEEGSFPIGDPPVRFRYAIVPHPSGRNRFWNNPENTQEACRFMSELMNEKSSIPRLQQLRKRARAIDMRQLGARSFKTVERGEMRGSGADCLPKRV